MDRADYQSRPPRGGGDRRLTDRVADLPLVEAAVDTCGRDPQRSAHPLSPRCERARRAQHRRDCLRPGGPLPPEEAAAVALPTRIQMRDEHQESAGEVVREPAGGVKTPSDLGDPGRPVHPLHLPPPTPSPQAAGFHSSGVIILRSAVAASRWRGAGRPPLPPDQAPGPELRRAGAACRLAVRGVRKSAREVLGAAKRRARLMPHPYRAGSPGEDSRPRSSAGTGAGGRILTRPGRSAHPRRSASTAR